MEIEDIMMKIVLIVTAHLLKEQGLTIAGVKKIISKNVNSLDDYKTSSIKSI